jgi:hypothetical protein
MGFLVIHQQYLNFNPTTKEINTYGNLTGNYKWIGGVLAPNGLIYGIPYYTTTILEFNPVSKTNFSRDVLLSPYLNKF